MTATTLYCHKNISKLFFLNGALNWQVHIILYLSVHIERLKKQAFVFYFSIKNTAFRRIKRAKNGQKNMSG